MTLRDKIRYRAAYDAAFALCPTPDEVLDVRTAAGTTRLYRFGTGEPLVLLPGMQVTAAGWAPLLPALSRAHAVYALDTMGEAGLSTPSRPLRTAADRVAWLDGVLAELELSGVHLVGGSSGGCYAVHQAAHAPGRLASVALLDPTTVGAGFAPRILALGLAAALVNRDWAWRWFLRATAGTDLIDRPDTRLVLTGVREFTGKLPPQLPPTREQMRSITLPVLAVYAGNSAVHNATKAARRTRDLIPHAEVELWPQARHSLHVDLPDRVTERLLTFTNGQRKPNSPDRPT